MSNAGEKKILWELTLIVSRSVDARLSEHGGNRINSKSLREVYKLTTSPPPVFVRALFNFEGLFSNGKLKKE